MSQVNNLTYLPKIRPPAWQQDQDINQYLQDVELWIKQVYDNLTGVTELLSTTVANLTGPTAQLLATDFDPATGRAATVYVSDESGGATLAFSDGTNWRRVQDRAIVS